MDMEYDAIVVGGGLFGSIITHKLQADGHSVAMIDQRRKGAGSDPAACLMKPSWFSGLGKDVTDPALALLDDLYGVEDIEFKVGPAKTKVHWVDPRKILSTPQDEQEVVSVDTEGYVTLKKTPTLKTGPLIRAHRVIVAAGVWCNEILPAVAEVKGLSGRAGVAFTWSGQIEEPFIKPWAPYRQLVAFNRGPDEIWVGDGSAILPENWDNERELTSFRRCREALGREDGPQGRFFGIRPYVPKAKPCYLKQHGRLWVATGGAKNGTISAAWCAHVISEEMK